MDDNRGLAGTDQKTNEGAGVPAHLGLLVHKGTYDQELVVDADL